MRLLPLLITFLFLPAVFGYQEGYIKVWEKELDNRISDVQSFPYHTDRERNDLVVACYDKVVYFFNEEGKVEGSFIGRSSFTAVDVYTPPDIGRPVRVAAGSLDDFVYGLWGAHGNYYIFSDPSVPKNVSKALWYFDADDDIYCIHAHDYDEDGKEEAIAVGTGNYYSPSPGKIILLNSTGSKIWENSYNSEVTFITSFDPDGDTFQSHLALAYSKTITVLDRKGSQIWSKSFDNEVTSITAADFEGKGEKTDLLVSEGNKIVALTSRNEILWEMPFNSTVNSVANVDRDKDGVIDYYVVSSGDYILGIENSDANPRILWKYYAGEAVGRIITFDLEGRGAEEDIAAYRNNTLAVYKKSIITLPRIKLSAEVGDGFSIRLRNLGDGDARDVSVDTEVFIGNLSLKDFKKNLGTLKRYTRANFSFPFDEKGNLTVVVTVEYLDQYGVSHLTKETFDISILPEKKEVIKTKENKTVPKPEIRLNISDPKKYDGHYMIDVFMENVGEGEATGVALKFNDTDMVTFTNGKWKGALKPGEGVNISFDFEVKREILRLRGRSIILPNLTLSYSDSQGNLFYIREKNTGEVRQKPRLIYLLILIPVLGVCYYLFRPKNRRGVNIEERVVEIFQEYREKGNSPPYSAFKGLGLEKKPLVKLIKKLKKEGKI